jgi:preprotein translocase subunit SecG
MIFAVISGLTIGTWVLMFIFAIVCVLMSTVILMQRPKNEGLGAAFGSGTTDQLFGARTTNVLQKSTVYMATLFFLLVLAISILINKRPKATTLVGDVKPAAAAPATPPATDDETKPEDKPLEPEPVVPAPDNATPPAKPVETDTPPATPEPETTPPAEKPAEEPK